MIRILGAGVAGLVVATELVARGADVEIVDPRGAPGVHCCSWWAGGMLAPFCEFENAEEPVLRHGKSASAWWQARTAVVQNGTLVVANSRDLPDLKRFSRRTDGFDWVDVGDMEPDLSGFDQGLFFADEAHLSPREALSALCQGLDEQGAKILTDAPSGAPETVIDCRGFAARDQLSDLRGVKGEMLLIHAPEINLTRPVRLLHPRIPLYVVPRGDGHYMLGATMIESEDRGRITARSMLELLSAAYALNPGFGEAEIIEIGVDLRPAFRDNLPRIRRRGRTVYANGLYRHGFLLAPALACGVADLVLDNKAMEFVDEDRLER